MKNPLLPRSGQTGFNGLALKLMFYFLILVGVCPAKESVYKVDPGVGISVAAAGMAITGGFYLTSDKFIVPRCPCDPNEVGGFDRSAIGKNSVTAAALSDVGVLTSLIAPVVLDFIDLKSSPEFYEDLLVFSQVIAVNSALVSFVKHAFPRPLPLTYVGTDPHLVNTPDGYRAFYSGHTSTAFAALAATAYTLNARYKQGVWPWLVAAGIGTGVGLARVEAGRHFYTDIIAGAVMGTGVGILIPWLYHRKKAPTGWTLVPHPNGLAVAVATNL